MKFKNYLSEERLDEVLITLGKRRPKFGQIVLLAGGAGCFDGNTEVQTKNGLKKISEINKDDFVLSMNEDGIKEYKQVQNTFIFQPEKEIIKLTLEDNTEIICTEDHEFFVEGKYIQAKDLLGKEL